MADSSNTLETPTESTTIKEALIASLFSAASPAMIWGTKSSSTGLTWKYYGGRLPGGGAQVVVEDGQITLTPSATNYIEADPLSGVPSANTSDFTAGKIWLYSAVCDANTVTSWTEYRGGGQSLSPRLAKAVSNGTTTLSYLEAYAQILEFSGAITAQRDVVVPTYARQWTVYNGTSGGFGLQIKTSGGSGVVIANGKCAIVYCDGTNVVRATADI